MRTGVITASYLDPLAVRIESVRPGKARGWRRFLVFGALTKGRKGSEYVALFTYFSFEGAEARMKMLRSYANAAQPGYASFSPKDLGRSSMPSHSIRS